MARRKGSGGGDKAKKKREPVKLERMPIIEKELRELALKLHGHLERASFAVVGKPKGSSKMCCGGVIKLTKVSKTVRAMIRDDMADIVYLAVIGLDRWGKLDQDSKRRALDHALCHAGGLDTEKDEWTLVEHDVQEFTAIIKRHGLDESPGLRAFVQAAKQLKLAGV